MNKILILTIFLVSTQCFTLQCIFDLPTIVPTVLNLKKDLTTKPRKIDSILKDLQDFLPEF